MIQWISLIQHIDTSQVTPLTSPLELMGGVRGGGVRQGEGEAEGGAGVGEGEGCRRREDVVRVEEGEMEGVMSNARYKDRGFFVVPKVVDVGD